MLTFDGQQEGERVLYEITPHRVVEGFLIGRIVLTATLFFGIILIIGSQTDSMHVSLFGAVFVLAALFLAFWWTKTRSKYSRAYITDRRFVRFEKVTPFALSKRALFWNEVLKAKAFEPNLLLKSYNVGTLIVEPQVQTEENIVIPHVEYAEDLANYIDKLLYLFKNDLTSIASVKPFVPKPRGHRDG